MGHFHPFKCLGVNGKLAAFQSSCTGVPGNTAGKQEASKLGQLSVFRSPPCFQKWFCWAVLRYCTPALGCRGRWPAPARAALAGVTSQNIMYLYWLLSWLMAIRHICRKKTDRQQINKPIKPIKQNPTNTPNICRRNRKILRMIQIYTDMRSETIRLDLKQLFAFLLGRQFPPRFTYVTL